MAVKNKVLTGGKGDKLLTELEVGDLLRMSPNTLRWWRNRKVRRGPNYVKIGVRVRYCLADLESYIEKRLISGEVQN